MQAPFVSQLAPPNWIPVKMSTVKTLYSPSAQTDEGEEGGEDLPVALNSASQVQHLLVTRALKVERHEFMLKGK